MVGVTIGWTDKKLIHMVLTPNDINICYMYNIWSIYIIYITIFGVLGPFGMWLGW